MGYAAAPAFLFKNAPQFKKGTPNTSGIPAILHDNEAVVPLNKGRKTPVDATGLETVRGGTSVSNSWRGIVVNVKTDDRIEVPAAGARLAETIQLAVDRRMQEATMYGGVLNPRGR